MENAKTVLVCMTNATEKWMRQNQIVKSKIPPKVAVFLLCVFSACTNRIFVISMLYQDYTPKGV